MSKERFCQNPITKEYFMVSKWKDLGNGKMIAENKRKDTKEEIKKFLLNIEGALE